MFDNSCLKSFTCLKKVLILALIIVSPDCLYLLRSYVMRAEWPWEFS